MVVKTEIIPRSKEFYQSLLSYISDPQKQKLREAFAERKYTVKETRVPYRVINHWDNLGILPHGVWSEGGWRKFNFPELVWLRVVQKLRNFGVSLERIAAANLRIMDWEAQKEMYPFFEFYLLLGWLSKKDVYINLWENGSADIATLEEIERHKLIHGSKDIILISIKNILAEIGIRSVKETEPLFSLSENELALFNEIRLGNNREITVKIGEKRQINQISGKSVKMGKFSKGELDRIIRQPGLYGNITVKVENGVEQFLEIVRNVKV